MSRKLGFFSVLAVSIGLGKCKTIFRIDALIFILSSLLSTSQCCEQTCYSAYKDGSLDLQEVQNGSPTIVPINSTGVVTIEAAYIPGYTVQWEYIRFMKSEAVHPLVMQFYTPQKGYITTLSIFAEQETGPDIRTRYSAYSLFNRKSDDIVVQVSDIHVNKDNFYRIYLGDPGKSHSKDYNYQSKSNWDELSFMRFNTTTQIKTDNRAIYFKSVSVCSEDSPVLCGESVETIAVSRGEAFNLSCSVYGAPYLEAVWSNSGQIRRKPVYSVDGFLHTTTISMNSFNGNHMGEWACYWRNENLGTFSGNKTFHVVEAVSKPLNATYLVQKKSTFKWIIRNKHPADLPDLYKILLECQQENLDLTSENEDSYMISMQTHFAEYSAISEHSATLILPENVTSYNITCTLYLVTKLGEKLGVLDTKTLYREGYNCEAGFKGVGEKCVKCEANHTSLPRSVTCFPIDFSELEESAIVLVTASADEKKEWETAFATNVNVKIGVVIGIILLLTLSITLVTVTVYIARKLDCL